MSKNDDNKNLKKNAFDVHIVTLGDGGVGKTCLIFRYIDNIFLENYLQTMGMDSQIKYLKLSDGKEIKIIITDTAGQERFKSLTLNYLKKANGILLVYDITDRRSFEDARGWAKQIEENTQGSIPMVLLGNKKDLEEKRCISEEEGENFAEKIGEGIKFYETSSKTGENVETAINDLALQIYNNYSMNHLYEEENNIELKKETKGKEKGKCC